MPYKIYQKFWNKMGKKFVKVLIGGKSIKMFSQDIKKVHRAENRIVPPIPSFRSELYKKSSAYTDI